MNTYDAILLTSFGGPESAQEVMPFLERVTAGRGIPRERLVEVSQHYFALGGVSPINAQNRELRDALQKELATRGHSLTVYFGNRNSHPFIADTLLTINEARCRRVLAFVTSAYSSFSGCHQYRNDLAGALTATKLQDIITIDKVRPYFDHPGFITPFADGLTDAITLFREQGILTAQIAILFSTHSIPISMSTTSGQPKDGLHHIPGGAYTAQHLAACESVIRQIKEKLADPIPDWSLVYQSRSGAPTIPWLEPDLGDAIRAAAGSGSKSVIIVPIGFVSDHMEVIWDLDNQAAQICDELNLAFHRVPTPASNPVFVTGIADLLEESLNGNAPKSLSPLGPWPQVCPEGCCPSPKSVMTN